MFRHPTGENVFQIEPADNSFIFKSAPRVEILRFDGDLGLVDFRNTAGNQSFNIDGSEVNYNSFSGANILNIDAGNGKAIFEPTAVIDHCEIDSNSQRFQLKRTNGDALLFVVDSINPMEFGAGLNAIYKVKGGNNSSLTLYHTAQPVLEITGSSKILGFTNTGTNIFQINGSTNNIINGDYTLAMGNSTCLLMPMV